jgi:hypothetical protein
MSMLLLDVDLDCGFRERRGSDTPSTERPAG